MSKQRITQVAVDILFLAACMYRRTIMRGHGRVNSFNWYTLQNPLTPVDAIIPSNFLLGIRRPSQNRNSPFSRRHLDKGQLGGSDVEGIDVRGQTGVSLLLAIGTVTAR